MLVDDVMITVKAGKGGDGAATFLHLSGNYKGGPNGGNGGIGGNIYMQGTSDLTAMQQFQFKKVWKAMDGIDGQNKQLYGKNGADLFIQVPLGTRVTDVQRKRTYEIIDEERRLLIAKGGEGGRGNIAFKSPTNRAPHFAEKGMKGEEKQIHLELRLIADVGLIGLPNAGKSSLLAALTRAHPKIANYPFTTLEPNLGVFEHLILADIPGLIEGASSGKGLGIKFLKHIEKTKILIHCIESTQENVMDAYRIIKHEFSSYNKELTQKPEIIFLTKVDLITQEEQKRKIKQLKKLDLPVYGVSIYDSLSLQKIESTLKTIVAT